MKLDVGCGPNKREGYVGLDFRTEYNPDILADIHNTDIESSSCEEINCTKALEHLYSPKIALEEMHRLLVPEGTLRLSVPNIMHYMSFLRLMIKGKLSVSRYHIYTWRYIELKHLLELCGFEILSTSYCCDEGYSLKKRDKLLAKIIPRVVYPTLLITCKKRLN